MAQHDIYQQAMEFLLEKDLNHPEKTILDTYVEKQRKYRALNRHKERSIDDVQARIEGNDVSSLC